MYNVAIMKEGKKSSGDYVHFYKKQLLTEKEINLFSQLELLVHVLKSIECLFYALFILYLVSRIHYPS